MHGESADSQQQRAVRWHPPAFDIRVEQVPVPIIEHPDDAVVKIKLAGLCGSDLHVYRGHEDVDQTLVCGHEFIGTVVGLGDSFSKDSSGRPELYSTLRIGDKVVSPFTVSCGECHFCRVGFTCRCVHSQLFGIPSLPGGQAQFVRVPKAGGTLFKVDDIAHDKQFPPSDSSLLLLADILPTGVFAALQALQHAKLSPMISGVAYPFSAVVPDSYSGVTSSLAPSDRILTIGIVGLGPVGVCAAVSLNDMLADLYKFKGVESRVIAIDPNAARRAKMTKIIATLDAADTFTIADIAEGKKTVNEWTNSLGCNAVLEIVGNNSALTLAYELVRPFGSVSSVGVHQAPSLPFIGREMYDKNVSFDFGRCPVRAMLPIASKILAKRQDIFGDIGSETSLIEKVVGFDQAAESYELFDKGRCGKILFDPWQ